MEVFLVSIMVSSKIFTYNIDDSRVIKMIESASERQLKNVNIGIHEAGFLLQGEVKSSIAGRRGEHESVDTGRFLQSIDVENNEDLVSYVYSPLDYPIYLEEGTSRIPARHHFANSFNRSKPVIVEKIVETLQK